jgi:hypothetical protein
MQFNDQIAVAFTVEKDVGNPILDTVLRPIMALVASLMMLCKVLVPFINISSV